MSLLPNILHGERKGDTTYDRAVPPSDEDTWAYLQATELESGQSPLSVAGRATPQVGLKEFVAFAREDAMGARRAFPRAWGWVKMKGLLDDASDQEGDRR